MSYYVRHEHRLNQMEFVVQGDGGVVAQFEEEADAELFAALHNWMVFLQEKARAQREASDDG